MAIPYQLIRSRRRSLELRVYPDHRIEVRAPMRCPQREIDAFINEREAWLQKRLLQFSGAPPAQPVQDGARVYLLGEALTLVVRPGRKPVQRDGDQLIVHCLAPDDPESLKRALQRGLRAIAEPYFIERLQHWFEPFRQRGHQRIPALQLRTMRSRWGSLSLKTGMTLNLSLIHSPPECIDYVIVHELCHLEQMNHGPRFKALMTQMLPDWSLRRRHLIDTAWSG